MEMKPHDVWEMTQRLQNLVDNSDLSPYDGITVSVADIRMALAALTADPMPRIAADHGWPPLTVNQQMTVAFNQVWYTIRRLR